MTMVLNVNKQEVTRLLDILRDFENPVFMHLKTKLKRLQATSEPVKSTIEQVRTATE